MIQATPQKKQKQTAETTPTASAAPTMRRDAVDEAAVVGVGNSHNEGEEDAVTNMDASILPGAEEMSGVDHIADQLLKPQDHGTTDNDSDGESPAPEDMATSEETAVMVFGEDDEIETEVTVPMVVQNGCETTVEPVEAKKDTTTQPSEVSWCSADGCAVPQKSVVYSINVASMSAGNSSHNSDTSDSGGEEDVTKRRSSGEGKGDGSRTPEEGKEAEGLEHDTQRGTEHAGMSGGSPKKDGGESSFPLYPLWWHGMLR